MGKYVYRKLMNSEDLVDWAKEEGLAHILDPKDLHVTIVYSNADFEKNPDPNTVKIKGGVRAIKKYPSTKGSPALVLEFNCRLFHNQHAAYRSAGAGHEYPTFKPHITITYKGSDIDVSKIEPYKGGLKFSKEYQEPLSEGNWQYTEIDL